MASVSSASIKQLSPSGGRSFAIFGSILTFKDEPENNGNAHLMFEHRERPNSSVGAHREPNHESWYVLEGTLEVEVEGKRHRLEAGDFMSIPPGTVHSLHNPGPAWFRVLTLVSPGAAHVRFFSTVGRAVADPSNPPDDLAVVDPQRLMAVARECGIEFMPRGDK
jgi:quercetin dioxygenase-like cupin family protein